MATKDFSVEVDAKALNALVEKLLDRRKTKPLMADLGRIMVADTMLNFRGQKSPQNESWKPIERVGQILRDTGILRNSITYRVNGVDEVRIGTNVEYARVHQYGYKYIAARPFLGFGPRATKKIDKAFTNWVDTLDD